MSKHLLYSKDLLNRTLTRSLLFALVQLLACLIVLTQAISPAEAIESLSVKTANPRYFFDSKGNPVYLTGSYLNQYNTLSGSWDFTSYLDFLQQQNQNFTRVWGWEQSPWIYDTAGQISFASQPYERTGPGQALDGGLKFDLTRFSQVYFDQLRSRVVQAAQRGIYVSVMLFDGFSTQKKMGRVNPWFGDPFQQVNNINGINGDPNRNGGGEEFFSLAFPSLVSLQETFARKVIDTLNDLDNVLYEVNGNGLAGSLPWQYHMIDYIRRYQKKPANQHPVGISDFYAGATAEVLKSSADWIVIQETNSNPPPATTKKILIMEGNPVSGGEQIPSTSPIALVQLLPDSVVSSQSSSISNNAPSSNGITLLSSSATSSTLATTQSSSNQQSQVATPTINPNGGVYSGTVAVNLQTTTSGAAIYYTTDGQSPTQSSPRYTGKFKVSGSTLVKAKAFKNNFDPSSEASAWFANAGAVSAPGLVAHWKFDEGSGTSASDASGNGNTATLVNGPVWSAGRVGNALFFDGINDNVTVADSNSLDLSSSFTLSAWVNPASTFTDFRSILVKNYSYYLYASVAGYCGDGSPLGGFSGGTVQTVCQPSPLPTNTWTHLAVTYNASTLTFYRDGVAVATSTVSGTLSPTSGTLQIGASQFGEYFKGLIDEVRIYNRALNDTEIQTVYQQESVATSQTVATPVISPSGGNYSGSVSATIQTATSGASIYYTTNGSTPTQSSTLYSGNMTLTNSATVKAKAFKSGSNASAEASASFTVTQAFSFSLSNSGDKSVLAGSSVTNSISAALTSGSAQAVTLSASGLPTGATASFSSATCSPTCSSTLTINASASTPAGSSTITVTAAGGGVTKTTTFSVTVSLPTMTTVATPTITPNGGSFTSSVSLTMQTATSGASIYYTTNGSSPTQSSTLYTGAMTLTSSATVKAKAFKSGSNASAEASASFNVSQPFNFSMSNSGDQSVVAGSAVTNSISATLASGSAQSVTFSASGLPTGATASFSSTSCSPTCSSTLTINASASTPAGSSNITVTAAGGGVSKTATFSLTVSLPAVATPAINPNGGSYTGSAFVAMQTATAGASIYYTTNGSSPTQSSTLYTGAITLTNSTLVKAKAFKSGYNPSAEANASFTVTPSDLVAYWKFDEGSGTSLTDSSGNGNNGTLVNGPLWSAGRVGNALFFDGTNDNVTVPDSNSLDLSSSFTLSAWVNPASTFTDFRSILVKNYSYYLYASVAGYCGDGSPLGGFSGITANTVCQPSPLPTNTWTHLAVTYNASTLTFYRDGVAVATSTVSGTLSPTTGTLQIGGSQFGEYFQGLIDEVRIYNKALNDTEIQTAYLQDSPSQTVTPVIPSVSQPFSFSLANSGDKSVVVGSSVTNSINTSLTSGSTQAVTLSASGLPTGATTSFSSATCSPTCSSALTINTSASTPAGSSTITVTAAGGGVTKTTTFSLTVSLPTMTTVATPTITPNGGNFSGSLSVAMQTTTSGASIYYTTNGSTPTQSSSLYTGPMTLTSDTTINAKAFKSGYNPSAVAAASFNNSQIAKGATYWASPTGTSSSCNSSATDPGGNYLSITNGVPCTGSGDTLMLKPGTYDIDWNLFGIDRVAAGTPSTYTTFKGSTGNRNDVVLRFFNPSLILWDHYDGGQPNGIKKTGDCRGGAECRYIEWADLTFDGSGRNSQTAGPMFKFSAGTYFWTVSSCFNDYIMDDCPGPGYIRFRNTKWDGGISNQNVGLIDTNSQQMGLLGGFRLEFLNSEFTGFIYALYLPGPYTLIDGSYFHDNMAMAVQVYDNGAEGCTGGQSYGDPNCTAVMGMAPHSATIRNSRFTRNGIYSGQTCYLNPPQIIVAGPSSHIYNNIFTEGPVTPCNPSGATAITIFGFCDNCFVQNNSIDGGNFGVYITAYPSGTRIRNNAGRNFVGNGGSDGAESLESGLVGVVGGGASRYTSANNIVNSSPGWANPSAGNMQISSSSPLYNAGTSTVSTGQPPGFLGLNNNMPAIDANGVTRPQSTSWDVGACEWFASAGFCPSLNVVQPSPAN